MVLLMTTTTRSTGSVVELAGQAEDHLSCLRSHQQGPLYRKEGPGHLVGMLCPTGTWAMLNGVILENRYSLRAALMNLVLSPGPNRFRDYAFVFR